MFLSLHVNSTAEKAKCRSLRRTLIPLVGKIAGSPVLDYREVSLFLNEGPFPGSGLLFPGLQFFKAISKKHLGLDLRVVEFVTLGNKER